MLLHPSAKVIVRSAEKPDMVLLIQRVGQAWHEKDYYEPAGGRVEADFNLLRSESLEECARREIAEELGIYVDIKEYIGSYYFFWSIDQKKLSVCAVFEGIVIGHDADFVSNKDSCELAFKAAWVPLCDIANGLIKVDPVYVGLEKVMKDYCARELFNK